MVVSEHEENLQKRRNSFMISIPWRGETPPPATGASLLPTKKSDPMDNKRVEYLRSVFNLFDSNSNGEVSASELGEMLSACGTWLRKQQVEEVLSEFDSDGSRGHDRLNPTFTGFQRFY